MPVVSTLSCLFDGVDEHALIGDVAPLQFERTNPYSISAWVKSNSATAQAIFSKMDVSPTFRGYLVNFSSAGAIQWFNINDNGTGNSIRVDTTTTGFANNVWRHIVVTYSGSSTAAGCKIYVDGTSRALTVTTDNLTATMLTTAAAHIGRRTDGGSPLYFNGNIDEVAVYNKELSAAEVTTIFGPGQPVNHAVTGPTANLVGYWRMGEGATFPTIPDDSTNSNAATLTNMEAGDIVADFAQRDFDASLLVWDPAIFLQSDSDIPAVELIVAVPAGPTLTPYFKMRGVSTVSGYETWTVANTPDFAGTFAPGPIVGGSAVVVGTFES